MAKTKISQFDATAANNTDLNSISIAEGTAPSNINNAIRELMSQLADLNLGIEALSTLKIDNLHLDGNTIITLDTNGDLNLTPNGTGSVVIAKADINGGAIDGTPIGGASASTGAFSTLSASSTVGLGSSVTISGGNIDGVIGANTPAAITGTVITANTNFAGNLTGNVTGNIDGIVGGSTPAAITGTTITANTKFVGALEGNVTAASGTSTFNNVTINGTLDMDSTTSQTITGLATPSGSTDAATKGYVDTEVSALVDSAPATLNTLNELAAALGDDANYATTTTNSIAAKLPLAGGTMTGDINANSNTVSGLKAPSGANDATTKTYVDTADALKLNLSGGTLSGNLAMGSNKVTGLDTPTATGDATTKGYVDGILGSATAAATSASAAATSATASGTSATASANSATASASSATSAAASYDSFDDRYLGAKGSAPTVDNDGDALLTGALYFNTSSNQLFVWTSGDAWTQAAFTASGFLSGSNNLSDVASASTSRTNLGLAIGSNVQAFDADLSALAGLTSAADKGIQFTGSGTAATYDLTSAGKALLDDADAAAQRTTLGLGSASTLTAGTSANNAVQLDGSAKLPAVDGSALTGMASGGTVSLVADGNITAGKPTILTAAGKAQQVAESTTVASTLTLKQITDMDGSDTATDYVATTYEASSERFVMFYRDTSNSNYPTLVAGSWSSGTVTWGTPLAIESTALAQQPSIDSGDGYVFTHYDIGTGKMRVYSISGTTFTLTANETVSSTNPAGNKIAYVPSSAFSGSPYDPVGGIACLIYSHAGSGSEATYVRSYHVRTSNGTVTGGTSEESLLSTNASMARASMVADPDNGKAIYATYDGSDGDVGKAVVIGFGGTASSPTDTVGTFVDYSGSDDAKYTSICYDTQNNKVFVSWFNDDGSDAIWKGAIGTVTAGTNAISFAGTATIWDSTDTNPSQADVAFDTDNNKIGFFYRDVDNSNLLTYKTITSGASSFSVASGATMSNGDIFLHSNSATYGTGKGFLVGLNDRSDSNVVAYSTGYYATSTTTNLTTSNFLGMAAESISDTATGKITINGGINENQSSLTIGTNYFATDAGLVATTGTQLIGKAVAADKIQVGVKSGTAAHNTVALDANAKLPAVDGSQLTNLPSPSDARIFCGKVNVLNYGANSFTISLPTGTSASSVRAYEIYFYGLSATGEADHNFRFKPYNGGSSVLSGNNWDGIVHQVYGLGGSNTNTAQDMDVWSTFLTPISWGSENVLSHSEPIQTDTGNGYSPRMNGKIVYENNVENAGYVYESFGLFSTGSGEKFMMETGITGAQNTNTVTNYADAFYFYLGTGNFASGVVSVYAII